MHSQVFRELPDDSSESHKDKKSQLNVNTVELLI